MAFAFTVNGKAQSVDVDANTPLLWVVREHLKLTGTKFGCGAGLCGACTVILDGQAVRSCRTPIADAAGKQVVTIEGVAALPVGKKLTEAWIALDVPQCGYCQAGQIMNAAGLLLNTPKPSQDELVSAMMGNVCRCACYLRIQKAIQVAAGLDHAGAKA